MAKIEDYAFPTGLHLLTRWQAGDPSAKEEMVRIFDAAIEGEFDENFSILAPSDRGNSTASVHMLALGVLHDQLIRAFCLKNFIWGNMHDNPDNSGINGHFT